MLQVPFHEYEAACKRVKDLEVALQKAIDYIEPRVVHTGGQGELTVLPVLKAALK